MTNFEKIKSMSIEEFAEFVGFNNVCDYVQDYHKEWCSKYPDCKNCIIDWLNSETNIDKKPDFTNHEGNALDYPN